MKPIKVIHVLEVEKEAHYFSNLVEFTEQYSIEHVFVNFAGPCDFSRTMERRGLRVYSIGKCTKLRSWRRYYEVKKIISIEKPDIVHTHLFMPTTIGLLAAKRQKVKTVLTRHHSDAVHVIDSMLKRSLYLRLEKGNNRRADHIIAPSRMVRDCILEWEGTPSHKVSLLPYPQTTNRFDIISSAVTAEKRAELGMNEQISLVCVSRLFHRKGHRYLFEALSVLVNEGLNVKLYLVGGGDHRIELERLADRLGISQNIVFLGWRDDVLEIIAASDIVVHPSLEDALSQSLIESLMLGKPIIATDISGAADTLGDGKYGYLVQPGESKSIRIALKDTIEKLNEAQDRARDGRAYILNYMDANRIAGEYAKIYANLVENSSDGGI